MEIRRLTATFGKLNGDTLELTPGLNFIHAPNESGKSTWCAFLRTMVYGLPTKVRGPAADKNRYAPWSGAAMSGAMEVETPEGELTITRTTARANSPMGSFSAVYTGTSTPVKDLTAASCGEYLTGVTREIFERSAFIRQAGLAIDQDAELERRIAALITTGEEDNSYIEVYERLKKQLTRRRYNKSGLLPQVERELEELRSARETAQGLTGQLQDLRQQESAQQQTIVKSREDLAAWDAKDQAAQLHQQSQARQALEAAANARQAAEQEAQHLPQRDALTALRGEQAALTAALPSLDTARQAAAQAEETAQAAQQAVQAIPPSSPLFRVVGWVAGVAALALAWFLPLPIWRMALGAGAALLLIIIGELLQRRPTAADQARAQAMEAAQTAQQQAQAAAAAYDALATDHKARETALLQSVQAFAPQVAALPDSLKAIDQALEVHSRLEHLRREEETCRLRLEMLPQPGTPRPTPQRDLLVRQGAEAESRLHQITSQIQYLSGRIQALSNTQELAQAMEETQQRRDRLQREYDAIALAMETLSDANTQLQNRFSPALGKKSAKIFAKLTDEKYNRVLLNRSLEVSAGESGDAVDRGTLQLSQGAVDQLYLAVRLAICEMVLPEDKAVPLVLDDALVNFDDRRMALALDLLVELAKHRQILLFSCHSREGDYLAKAHPGAFHTVTLA